LEPFRTFSFRTEKGKPFVASARRKCLFLYFYFINRDFGLMPVKLQTRFPMPIQVYVNGHEWLARKLKQHAIRYTKRENAFYGLRIWQELKNSRTVFVLWIGPVCSAVMPKRSIHSRRIS